MKNLKDMINEASAKFDKKANAITWNGANPCWAVINTADYMSGSDYTAAIQICELKDLPDAGFDEESIAKLQKMNTSDTMNDNDFEGVVVVRLV